MKKISKRDLIALKAGLAYYDRDPENYHCNECPMGRNNNRLGIPCCDFIRRLGGQTIFKEAADEGYDGQHNAIKYLIKISYNRAINI